MMESSYAVDKSSLLASERWNVEKKRREWDEELRIFRKQQKLKLQSIRLEAREKVSVLHEKLFFKVRWADPPLSAPFRTLLSDYSDFLISSEKEQSFPQERLLAVWFEKLRCSNSSKLCDEIKSLCSKIKLLVQKRENGLMQTTAYLLKNSEKMTIKKEGELRWQMENNINSRDHYWTIWYLAKHAHIPELKRFLQNKTATEVNEADQDFGFTALHYACKISNLEVAKILLAHGCNENAQAPDGRTPLHFAACYGSVPIVLELLASGANYYAKDNFNCTALDLAVQNANTHVVEVLHNWVRLVPQEIDTIEQVVEDLTGIPDEYLATPLEIRAAMSLKLQVLTNRLQGQGSHSFNVSIDPSVELRLCERHAALCFEEGLQYEAFKSLRRRWRVAKKLCGYEYEGSGYSSSYDNTPANFQFHRIVDIEMAKQIHKINDTISRGEINVVNSLAADEENVHASDADNQLPVNNSQYNNNDNINPTNATTNNNEITIIDNLPLLLEKKLEISNYTRHNNNNSKISDDNGTPLTTSSYPSTSITPSFAIEIGCHLAECLIAYELEGQANEVFAECLLIRKIEAVSRINVLYRRCEVLLFLFDRLEKDKKESERTLPRSVTRLTFPGTTATATSPSAAAVNAEEALESRKMALINDCEGCAREAFELLSEMHKDDVLEPLALAPILERLAAALERKGLLPLALGAVDHASAVCERILGAANAETVRVMLEGLRLQICCTTSEGYTRIGCLATDISRRLDRLARVSPQAADKLARRCAELLALSRILEAGEAVVPHTAAAPDNSPGLNSTRGGRSNILKASTQDTVGPPEEVLRWAKDQLFYS